MTISHEGNNLVFLLSLPRSGSTLLSLLLSNHSALLCPPEPWFLLKLACVIEPGNVDSVFYDKFATIGTQAFLKDDIFIEAARAFASVTYNKHLRMANKAIFVDKTPRYYHYLKFIDQLFPKARKIWLKRNPLDVALSYKKTWQYVPEMITRQVFRPASLDFVEGLFNLTSYFSESSADKLVVEYEALVESPREILTDICHFLEVEFEDSMLRYHQNEDLLAQHRATSVGDKNVLAYSEIHTHSVGKWVNEFSLTEINEIVKLLGFEIFRSMGYQKIISTLETLGIDKPSEGEAARLRNHISITKTDTIAELQRQLQASEVNQTKTYKEMDLLQREIQAMQEQLQISFQQLQAAQQQLQETRQQLHLREIDRTANLEKIHYLEQQIAALSTTEAAVGKIIGVISHKLGIYNFLRRHEDFWRRIYYFLRDHFGSSKAFEAAAASNKDSLKANSNGSPAGSSQLIDPDLTNAPVSSKIVDSYSQAERVNLVENIGLDCRHVLCLSSSSRNIEILQALSKSGAVEVTCLDCGQTKDELGLYGFNCVETGLAQWLMMAGKTTLAKYDCLLLDAQIDNSTLLLLKGRLGPQTRILLSDILPATHPLKATWGTAQPLGDQLEIYLAPPAAWLEPIRLEAVTYRSTDWPWKPPDIEFPPALPSGRPWPKITIVTVSFNQGIYLEETIRSVLLQGYPNLEYIVIDGGSTDYTPVVLERYRAELAYCISEPDKGQANALNKGFAQATGDILAWLNSDDRYLPATLFRVALAFDTYETDIIAGGCGLVRDNQLSPWHIHHTTLPVGQVVSLPLNQLLDVDGLWLKGNFFYQPEIFWTRRIWERSGARLDEALFYGMDYELWLRYAQQGAKIVHIPDTLALFRMHDHQKTSGDVPYAPELRQISTTFRKNYDV